MKKSDIYEIAIKILGLYLVVVVIEQLREVLIYASVLIQSKNDPSVSNIDQTPLFLVIVISFIILTAFAGLLIFRTKAISVVSESKKEKNKGCFFNIVASAEKEILC